MGLSCAGLAWLALGTKYEYNETFSAAQAEVAPVSQAMAAESPPLGSLEQIGMALFGPFALPFEMASLVLLAAIVGAIVLAKRRATGS
jgi:NADH:ubiquinone oxidoreductase subunit 6 (subunit J)